jgi:hypothetical protein
MTVPRRSAYRRCVTWMRAVLPPAWTVALFVVLYVITEAVRILLQWLVVGEDLVAAAVPRNSLVLVAVALYAMFRVIGFHPLARADYGAWLFLTPWRHPQPLPLGPVRLTAQDGLLVALAVLLCHGTVSAQWTVVQVFLVAYLSALCMLFWHCELRWRTYALVFGLGLSVWLNAWSITAATAVAVALYPLAVPALSASLAGFPWPEAIVQKAAALAPQRTARKQQYFDRTVLGWPWDLLQSPIEVPRRNWLHLAVETLLTGWVAYACLSVLPPLAEAGTYCVLFYLVVGLCGARLFARCWHCRPPINLWGRLFTGRWLIPAYDLVFVGPLAVLVVGLLTPIVMRHLAAPEQTVLAVSLAATIGVFRGLGPSWPRWLLTGKHRLVPGVTNRKEFEEL